MLGHIPVDSQGERCPCGGIGCLELYVSITSLMNALSVKSPAELPDIDTLLAVRDPALMAWLNTAVDKLTTALVTVDHLMSPAAIIFGGPMHPALREYLDVEVTRLLPERRMRALKKLPAIIQASILESAAVVGAATLPLFAEFTQNIDDKNAGN